MKTIRQQLKLSNMFTITYASIIQFIVCLQTEQQIETTNKKSIKICKKTLSKL